MSLFHKALIISLALILTQFIPQNEFQTGIAFFLILVFGIPHGATDHVLSNIMEKGKIETKPQVRFLIYYIGIILIYAAFWYLLPGISLLIFLAVSAYHFGETQLIRIKGNNLYRIGTYFVEGASILLVLFYPHLTEIASLISPYLVPIPIMNWIIEHYFQICLLSFIVLLSLLLKQNFKLILTQIIELIILYVLALNTSLLLSFAIFFAFWHSRDATFLQLTKIRTYFDDFNFKKWLLLATPYSIASLFGIAFILIISEYLSSEMPVITMFFILVALITLPHVFVMASFYRKVK